MDKIDKKKINIVMKDSVLRRGSAINFCGGPHNLKKKN